MHLGKMIQSEPRVTSFYVPKEKGLTEQITLSTDDTTDSPNVNILCILSDDCSEHYMRFG